jgi:hypothetical protein
MPPELWECREHELLWQFRSYRLCCPTATPKSAQQRKELLTIFDSLEISMVALKRPDLRFFSLMTLILSFRDHRQLAPCLRDMIIVARSETGAAGRVNTHNPRDTNPLKGD